MITSTIAPRPSSVLRAAFLLPAAWALSCHALDLTYANKGTDSVFFPQASSTTINLGAANDGAWDSAPSVAGNGVYDETKWAVVYKFSSVNIPSGVTVRFQNNASRAPVVWLVDGDVKIDGTIDLSGQGPQNINGEWKVGLNEPGPGGFAGGSAAIDGSAVASGGFGPGGGNRNSGAGFAFAGVVGEIGNEWWQDPVRAGGFSYGDAQMLSLIGGSGGGGDGYYFDGRRAGGAGGGAILVVSKGQIIINGKILSNGGSTIDFGDGRVGAGSGGTVRLVSEGMSGSGLISVAGGTSHRGRNGSSGRIRLESKGVTGALQLLPPSPLARPDNPVRLWPDETTPSARIVSIGTETVPSAVTGWPQLALPDVTLKTSASQHPIIVETRNLPNTTEVIVRVVPTSGAPREIRATLVSIAGSVGTWTAYNDVPPGLFVAQVRAKAR